MLLSNTKIKGQNTSDILSELVSVYSNSSDVEFLITLHYTLIQNVMMEAISWWQPLHVIENCLSACCFIQNQFSRIQP
jgi:hypothetical protein